MTLRGRGADAVGRGPSPRALRLADAACSVRVTVRSKPASSAVTCPSPSARLPPLAPSPRTGARHHPDNPGSLPAATPWTRTHLRSPFDSRGGTFAGSGIGHTYLRCCHYSVVIRLNVFLMKGPKSRSDTEGSSAQPGLAPGPLRPQPLEPADPVSASIGSGCSWPLGRVFFS